MRQSVKTMAVGVAGLLAVGLSACGGGPGNDGDSIKVGAVYDTSGVQRVVGQSMLDALNLAVDQINADGGVLGKQLTVRFYDSGGDIANYKQYAEQLALRDEPAVAFAGINGASRAAIQPIFSRAGIPYIYSELNEGGICEKNTFSTGVVPSQSLAALVPRMLNEPGKTVYIAGADYNFGHISGQWGRKFAEEAGARVVGERYIPLESSDFGSVVDEIQRLQPDLVLSFLVGANHQSFYRSFAAAGLNKTTPIASSTFGTDGETEALSAAEQENIYVAYPYIQSIESPENTEFIEAWENKYGALKAPLPDEVNSVWSGLHLWAEAVEKAGELDQGAVIEALESGIEFTGPAGRMQLDPASHNVIQNVSIGRTNGPDGYFEVIETRENVAPSFEQEVCDLISNPDLNEQFTPTS
ncbi:ABC transporter substrate-binding protein [[Mycobacterium] wendilense]|uniref:Transporter substrate-binding protein n=1 Tax=[Mycobacterium] wendilense TaxID=3064284 RepID=A0ABN9P3V3_9MYCO|nr:ABC transporter substrate-binding protein [Mycolicibacterium sp. MU0050]CAJ1584012.1 transporter substrate-binding protein [Mycolicibacterium sp. MU0050]